MARNLEQTERTAHELSKIGGKVIALRCDMANPDDIENMLGEVERAFAAEWAPKNIRVNSISPGYTVTELTSDVISPHRTERVPMHKIATPEDMAGALIYLASDASAYTTGVDILVDGGFCIW